MSLMSSRDAFSSPADKSTRRLDRAGNLAVSSKPATEKAHRLCQMCCDETAEYSVCDGWTNGDAGGRKLRRLARGCRRGRPPLGPNATSANRNRLLYFRTSLTDAGRICSRAVRHRHWQFICGARVDAGCVRIGSKDEIRPADKPRSRTKNHC